MTISMCQNMCRPNWQPSPASPARPNTANTTLFTPQKCSMCVCVCRTANKKARKKALRKTPPTAQRRPNNRAKPPCHRAESAWMGPHRPGSMEPDAACAARADSPVVSNVEQVSRGGRNLPGVTRPGRRRVSRRAERRGSCPRCARDADAPMRTLGRILGPSSCRSWWYR